MMGMNFSTLCMRHWTSTVWFDKPKPYPPTDAASCCSVCVKELSSPEMKRACSSKDMPIFLKQGS